FFYESKPNVYPFFPFLGEITPFGGKNRLPVVTFTPLVTTFTPLVTTFTASVITFVSPVTTSRTNPHEGKSMNTAYSCPITIGGKAVKREVIYGSLY
ncbi:MAG: hypothetical protein LBD96_03485, partial [Treponema sp.]|nr:hypothetical protein [Treponema sp.]